MATLIPTAADERLVAWWRLRSRSEQRMLIGLAIGAAALVAWLTAWQPLERDSVRLRRQITGQQSALVEARRQADEIAGLMRSAPPSVARDPRADIEAALARQGLKAAAIERIDQGRLRLTFDSIAFNTLAAWLESLQRDARLRVVALTATGRVEPGQVRAELTLSP